jgi:hypothetical protein
MIHGGPIHGAQDPVGNVGGAGDLEKMSTGWGAHGQFLGEAGWGDRAGATRPLTDDYRRCSAAAQSFGYFFHDTEKAV